MRRCRYAGIANIAEPELVVEYSGKSADIGEEEVGWCATVGRMEEILHLIQW